MRTGTSAARLATTVRLIGRKTLVSEIGPKVIQAADDMFATVSKGLR